MIEPLAIAITVVAALAALVTGSVCVAGTYRWTALAPTLALVEAALAIQAVVDLVGIARGHRPGEPGVHLAYLATSVLVIPAAAAQVRGDDDRWSGALCAAALLVVAVLVVRLATTWHAGATSPALH